MKRKILLVIALLLVLFAAWRMLVLGMSEHYVRSAVDGDATAAEKALSWNPAHPKALYLKALEIKSSDPQGAVALLQRSIDGNPADARPVVELAHLLLAAGAEQQADALAEQAVVLMPAYVPVRLSVANYWIKREQWLQALENWRAVLITNKGLGKRIYPVMLKIAETEQARELLHDLALDPPSWWDDFFQYVTNNAQSLDAVVALASMRQGSGVPLSAEERKHLVSRLIREQHWPQAYLIWINGLSEQDQKHLGGIYNGGFELDIQNQGFGWHFPGNNMKKKVKARRQAGLGITGDKALHLIFSNKEFRFNQVRQYLFLSPGEHRFSGRYRVDRLQGRGGLRWALYCVGEPQTVIAESHPLLGTGDWDQVQFDITVPESEACIAQVLRLESTGLTAYDHKLEGDIWFDGLSIRAKR